MSPKLLRRLVFFVLLGVEGLLGQAKFVVYFDNPSLELRSQRRKESASFPFGVFPVERSVRTKVTERIAILELLKGPTRAEQDTGYSSNLSDLTLENLLIRKGTASVKLKGRLLLKGTLSGPRLRLQVERTLRHFKNVKKVEVQINGRKDFDSLK